MIFSDGFESGTFSAWTAAGGTVMLISAGPDHVHDGARGAHAQQGGWCYKSISPARRVSWKFWFKPVYAHAQSASLWRIARLTTSSGGQAAMVTIEQTGGSGYAWTGRLGLRRYADSGSYVTAAGSGPDLASCAWCLVELRYVAATEPGAADGHVELWQNGARVLEISGVDNDALLVGRCYLDLQRLSGTTDAWVSWDTAQADAFADRGYRIYSNGGAGSVNWIAPVASRNQFASSWTSPALGGGATHRFGVRAYNEFGEEKNINATADVTLLGSGLVSPARPNRPTDLAARPAEGGNIAISFSYDSTGEAAACSHFHVYADDGTGAIDYGSALGSVSVVDAPDASGLTRYEFADGPFADGVPRRVAVRAATAGDVEDDGAESVAVTPDAAAPAQPATLFAAVVP